MSINRWRWNSSGWRALLHVLQITDSRRGLTIGLELKTCWIVRPKALGYDGGRSSIPHHQEPKGRKKGQNMMVVLGVEKEVRTTQDPSKKDIIDTKDFSAQFLFTIILVDV